MTTATTYPAHSQAQADENRRHRERAAARRRAEEAKAAALATVVELMVAHGISAGEVAEEIFAMTTLNVFDN